MSGIRHVNSYMDDVVADHTEAEHLRTVEEVLARLEQYGVRLNSKFMLPSVEYLGFHISGDGVRPTQEKLQAIVDAPAPKDVSHLKSFLGLVNYNSKFLHHLANTLGSFQDGQVTASIRCCAGAL